MTPLAYYNQHCAQGLILDDPAQREVVSQLESIYQQLVCVQSKRFILWWGAQKTIRGLYLCGSVGIGKTFLMDCLYHCLPVTEKKRMHFHQFMRYIHRELKAYQGKKNPITLIAKKMAKHCKLLCLDEFFVTDVGDAIILANLLKALFAEGVCLVTTSNILPDDLYRNGLQRDLFLPAIALIKEHTRVMHLTANVDYRLRHLKSSGVFFTPDDAYAENEMQKCFVFLAGDAVVNHDALMIEARRVNIKKSAGKNIWLHFRDICAVPRSQQDYLWIAENYDTVFISHIPLIAASENNTILLFIRLIDVLYDARIRLIASAAVPVRDIYTEGRMIAEYARTCSRLIEMQSEGYIPRT
ncbi:MAG TPA: cell division protein ZapE [Gammaproteobacteria bacterium]|jgi:cell division protein ZapE|nr:cell division protein ZapE [Gammaproteobacteria bacterium]